MQKVLTGLDILTDEADEQKQVKGNIAYLGHQASVNRKMQNGLDVVFSIFGSRVTKAFGPQHGFATTAQDNMIETPHEVHPLHGIPVYSLYSETRIPTDEMLDQTDCVLVDLQDVGTRVYTYIWTLYHLMQYSLYKEIQIVVLDRPNPIGGLSVQGNLPEQEYFSFVCRSQIPMRHGMTIGELALWFKKFHFPDVTLKIIPMRGWERRMHWQDTGLLWVNPSPNLPTPEGCLVYPGTVLFEGTTISEGRGTTRSLELFGHPAIDPYKWKPEMDKFLTESGIKGQVLRPVFFEPVFHKFKRRNCGGFQIHVQDRELFNPWKLGQLLLNFFIKRLDLDTFWSTDPYEYEFQGLAIDWINGTEKIRRWVEAGHDSNELIALENTGRDEFMELRHETLIYPE